MTNVYIGELTDYALNNWLKADEPFDILKKENEEEVSLNWIEFMWWANSNLKDQFQVDWGSFAWRCDKEDMTRFCNDYNTEPWEDEFISQMDPAKEYGAVLIEMY